MSIKLRITLWFTIFMTVLAGLAIWVMIYAGERQVQAAFSQELVHSVENKAEGLEWKEGSLLIGDGDASFVNGVYLSIYNDQGQILWGEVPTGFDTTKGFVNRDADTVDSGGVTWQVYDAKHQVRGHNYVWVRGVMQEAGTTNVFDSILNTAYIVLPLFILLAALGGYFIIHRALRPVRKITETAQAMGEGKDLSERINLGKGRDEVYRLATAFDSMLGRLQGAFENEKQFTADASHELRTPVSVIISQCEAALEQGTSEAEYREALDTVLDQAEKMSMMISQLLTLARADKGHEKLHLEEVNFSELTEMVALQQEERATLRNIDVLTQIQKGIEIQGDETMLMRLWVNLVDNAIKYGREGGRIVIRLELMEGGVQGSVIDDGVGITSEDLPKVWGRFWQGSSSRRTEGTGLGLSMVKWIVEAHDGEVSVESRQGHGSTFSFFLPIS